MYALIITLHLLSGDHTLRPSPYPTLQACEQAAQEIRSYHEPTTKVSTQCVKL